MTAFAFIFYLFSAGVLIGGLMTVIGRNPVHSVLWLILTFFSASGLFVILSAEFVAMLMMVVYVGAVAVLFLFVVMMLDVDFAELKAEMSKSIPIAVLIAIVILVELAVAFGAWDSHATVARAPVLLEVENTRALGLLIYDRYFHLFQIAGLILFVAMIGAIMLTLRHRTNVKRQDITRQIYRDPKTAMELKDVKPGQGL